jgi:hypothetical protein
MYIYHSRLIESWEVEDGVDDSWADPVLKVASEWNQIGSPIHVMNATKKG